MPLSQTLPTYSSPKSSPGLRRQAARSDLQADRPSTFPADCSNSTSHDKEPYQGYSSSDEASNASTPTGNETRQSIMETSLGRKQTSKLWASMQTISESKESCSTKPISCQRSKEREKVYIKTHRLKTYNTTPALVCTY